MLWSTPTGVLPDTIVFTPDGRYVVTDDEGQPGDDYTVDPVGTVTVIDVSEGIRQSQGFDRDDGLCGGCTCWTPWRAARPRTV